MKPLDPPDSQRLEAALGWVEFGNHLDANEELVRIDAKNRAHPDVMQVRWRIYALAGKWDAFLNIANAIIKLAPDRAFGWLHRCHSLRKLNHVQEALDGMLDAMNRFPPNATMPYYAACYCAQLGRIPEARTWLEKAFTTELYRRFSSLADSWLHNCLP